MISYLLSMAAIMAIGACWRSLLASAEAAHQVRNILTQSVYLWFLPALVLHMLWSAEVNGDTLRIPLLASICIVLSGGFAWLIYRLPCFRDVSPAVLGAMVLAASFGNFTYIGLPVLTGMFGEQAGVIAIQFDLLAATPLLFTVGVLLASHYGHRQANIQLAVGQVLRVPALWAAAAGLTASILHIPLPESLLFTLQLLAQAVIPLMLLSVGMALRWQTGWLNRVPALIPVILAQLVVMPVLAYAFIHVLGISTERLPEIVIEAGMPTMVLGLVICDRFSLDSSSYAEAITLTTLVSFVTLPLWLWMMPVLQ